MDIDALYALRREVIRRLIQRRFGESNAEFAKAAGVAPPTVTRWLNGSKNIGEAKALELEEIPALSLAPRELFDPRPQDRTARAEESAMTIHHQAAPPAGVTPAQWDQLQRDLPLMPAEDRTAFLALAHDAASAERRREDLAAALERKKARARRGIAQTVEYVGSHVGKPRPARGARTARKKGAA